MKKVATKTEESDEAEYAELEVELSYYIVNMELIINTREYVVP